MARYAAVRDEEAFRELVRRHGAMVLATCARMLRHRQDAEDAFQAVCVILAARSRSLRRVRSLGGWLHNVAVHVSYRAQRGNRRRTRRLFATQRKQSAEKDDHVHELQEVLDEELSGLPAKYREALILCVLEGYTREEAAQRMNTSAGTVATWVARGRRRLRDRLVRRGVTLGAGGMAVALAQCTQATTALPAALTQSTIQIAELFALGTSVSGVAAVTKITSLAQGELNRMFLTKLSTTVGIVALAIIVVLGAGSTPASKIVGFVSQARAGQLFIDDFEDGSILDGNPVSWRQEGPPFDQGIVVVQNGDLSITPPNTLPFPFVDVNLRVDGLIFGDVSLRTRLRALGSGAFSAGINARNNFDLQNGLIGSWTTAQIRQDGRLVIGAALNDQITELAAAPSQLNPTLYDVNLQFDVIGRTATLTAWRDGTPMPGAPQLTAALPNHVADQGAVGVFNAQSLQQNPKFAVAFRHFQLVPEPSSVTLGSLSGIALASFAFRSRLVRVDSAR
jgi:RNA polymerase sigma factor (sigma-70 family)